MINKMGPSEGFIEKSLEVQINEILEEDVPSSEENVVHYYVDVEGDVEPKDVDMKIHQKLILVNSLDCHNTRLELLELDLKL
jgi:hypothetical protein